MTEYNYKITCCSTTDMPPEFFSERDVPLAYFHFTLDGADYPDDMGKTIPLKEFYERIDAGAMPSTSQVNTETYIALFEPFLQAGTDVLHIALSSAISGSCGSAKIAERELRAKYPERRIYVVDSLAASSGYGLLVDAALDMREDGAAIDEVYAWLETHKLNMHHWFFTANLKHLRRGGRVSSTSAVVGTFLNICPILNVNDTGHLTARGKARGKKHVIAELVNHMKKHAVNGTAYSGKCFISNSACYEDAEALADAIRAEFKSIKGDILINDIGTVIGSHTGPGTVALFFWGDARVD
jgi:DegV family protein with EDD domain